MQTSSCKADKTIYRRGDTAANLYLIQSGQVHIMGCTGDSTRLCTIVTFSRGEFFGRLAFLNLCWRRKKPTS